VRRSRFTTIPIDHADDHIRTSTEEIPTLDVAVSAWEAADARRVATHPVREISMTVGFFYSRVMVSAWVLLERMFIEAEPRFHSLPRSGEEKDFHISDVASLIPVYSAASQDDDYRAPTQHSATPAEPASKFSRSREGARAAATAHGVITFWRSICRLQVNAD